MWHRDGVERKQPDAERYDGEKVLPGNTA